MFCECKWSDKVDAEKLLIELKEKAKHVEWNADKRKESYAIFAKSFKNKRIFEDKKSDKISVSFKTKTIKDVKLYDLKDLEKILKKK